MEFKTSVEKYDTWYASANDKDKKIFRDWLRGLLLTEEVSLKFKKQDGTIRDMFCSLKSDKLPPMLETKAKPKKLNEDVLTMFDLDKKEWRSCRFDSIINITFTLGK